MKPTRLLFLASPDQPSPWLMISPEGRVLQRGALEAGDPVPGGADAVTVAVAPGADVLMRWALAPGRTEAQARAAALFALGEVLAAPPEESTLALGPVETDSALRLAAVVADTVLAGWVDRLRALGLEPDVLCPDVLLLAPPEDDESLVRAQFGDRILLRGRHFAFAGEPELAELLAAGREVRPLDGADRLEDAFVQGALAPPVNLLRRPVRSDPRRWRRAGLLAALVLASPILLTAAVAMRDDYSARRMTSEAEALVRAHWPEAPAGQTPVATVRALSLALQPGGAASAAAALFSAMEQVEGAELDGLAFDETGLRATLSHAAYEDVEALKAGLAASGLALTTSSTENDGDRIVSEIVIGAEQ